MRSDSEPGEPTSKSVPYKVVQMGGSKALGAVSLRDINRGEVIITDTPLVVWPQSLSSEQVQGLVSALNPRARKAFESLANAKPDDKSLDPLLAIRATNGFAVSLPEIPSDIAATSTLQRDLESRQPDTASFVFPNISRINHSCLPNADHAIDWTTLRMSIYATIDIPIDTEISIEYTAGLIQKSRVQRRDILNKSFGFTCGCPACSLSENDGRASDQRRKEVDQLVGLIAIVGQKGASERPKVLKALERIRVLLEEENYQALPEFTDLGVSSAYAMYARARRDMSASELGATR